MIKTETVKIKYINGFDNSYIEKELSKFYKSVIRWAITDIDYDISVMVSYEADVRK